MAPPPQQAHTATGRREAGAGCNSRTSSQHRHLQPLCSLGSVSENKQIKAMRWDSEGLNQKHH